MPGGQRWLVDGQVVALDPLVVQAEQAITHRQAGGVVVDLHRRQLDVQGLVAPAQQLPALHRHAAAADAVDAHAGLAFVEQARRVAHVAHAACGADPHRTIRIFGKRSLGNVIPDQPLRLRQMRPALAVVDLDAACMADPDPADAVAAQQVHADIAQRLVADFLQVKAVVQQHAVPQAGAIERQPHLTAVADVELGDPWLRRAAVDLDLDLGPLPIAQPEQAVGAGNPQRAVGGLLDVGVGDGRHVGHLLQAAAVERAFDHEQAADAEHPQPALAVDQQAMRSARQLGDLRAVPVRPGAAQDTCRIQRPQAAVLAALHAHHLNARAV